MPPRRALEGKRRCRSMTTDSPGWARRAGDRRSGPPLDQGRLIVVVVVIVVRVEENAVALVADLGEIGFRGPGGVGDEREAVRVAAKLRLLTGRPRHGGPGFQEAAGKAVLGVADLDLPRDTAPVDLKGNGGGNARPQQFAHREAVAAGFPVRFGEILDA